jgi:2-iminobutanoate/2-iminopropanoate deaminase
MPKKAIGSGGGAPYSPAIQAGNLLFVSGQVGSDPATKQTPPDVESQTRICLERIKAILEQAGTTMENVVRANVYLTNIADFSKMNGVYRTFFTGVMPARTTVQAALAAPQFLVEIDVVALVE